MKFFLFPEISIAYQNSKKYIPTLDGIRGLAICLVIAFHCFKFSFGWSGVDLFFVLSGFLITGILLDSKRNNNYFRNFWAKRILRIFPLYYLVLILLLIPKIVLNVDSIGDPSWTYWFYLENWKFTSLGSFPEGKGTLNHFWSLAIEEQFYLIFPVIIRYCKPKILIGVLLFFILSSNVFRFYFWQNSNIGYYVFTFSRIDALSIGALLAYTIRNNSSLLKKIIFPIFYVSFLITMSIIIYSYSHFSNKYFATWGFTVVAILYSTLIVFCVSDFRHNIFKIIFKNKFLIYLGKISYGLYVFHWILYILFKPWLELNIENILHHPFLSKTVVSLLIVAFTILLSHISYNLFEKRFLVLKRKFSN